MVLAIEKLLGIELTPRCRYIRTIIAELARISDHLLCNGAVGLDTGAFTFFLYGFYQREVIYDIFETLWKQDYRNIGIVLQSYLRLRQPSYQQLFPPLYRQSFQQWYHQTLHLLFLLLPPQSLLQIHQKCCP